MTAIQPHIQQLQKHVDMILQEHDTSFLDSPFFDYVLWINSQKKIIATNQDVLLFKLLTFWGVLLSETCY
jgi:hypothetical protein